MRAAIMKNAFQQNTRRPANGESMLAHRLRRWPNTDSTPGELPVPAGMCQKEKERKVFHAWRHRGQRQTVTHVQELSISFTM